MPGQGMSWKVHNFGKGTTLRQPQFWDRAILRKTRLGKGTMSEEHDFATVTIWEGAILRKTQLGKGTTSVVPSERKENAL